MGIVVVAVLAVALIAGGVFFFLNGTSLLKKTDNYGKIVAELTAETPDELDKELQALDLGVDIDSEFTEIDSDLSSL
ncbi:MAG: hypothetical protein AAB599_00635 [Patescibacteria group bacterium]